jgi:hypothetical protein
MYPHNISSQEAYGKHRNSEEIRQMESRTQILNARSYKYGDPVNSKLDYDDIQTKNVVSQETVQHRRSGVPLLARVFLFFLPFLGR